MLENTKYVIYAYGIVGSVILVYSFSLFFGLKRIYKKLSELEGSDQCLIICFLVTIHNNRD